MTKIKKTFLLSKKRSPFELILGFFSLLIIFLSAVFFYFQFKSPLKLETVKVSLVWLNQAQFAGIYTAIDKGFYEDVGIKVELEEFGFAKLLEDELAEGKTDFSIIHSVRLLEGIGRGLDLKAVAAIYQTSPHAFVSSKDNVIKKPEDLKGKTLGIKGDNISAKILYSVLLTELGLKNSDVKFKSVDFTTHEFEDIQNGMVDTIDLYRTDQVYFFEKNNVDYQLIPPENFRFDMYGDVIATSDEMIKKNPKLVKNFVQATIKGWEYAIDNQDEAIEMTQQYITSEDYKDEDYNKFILEMSSPLIKPVDIEKVGKMVSPKWNNLYDAMVANNIIKEEFDPGKAFTLEFLD
jgi:NitT/TauT family transport system substrate-binding protein